jgi:hypothetical protein
MKAGSLSLIVTIIYLLIFILPLRIDMWRKYGQQSYRELRKLADEGNENSIQLLRRGKFMLVILIGGTLIELFLKSVFKI